MASNRPGISAIPHSNSNMALGPNGMPRSRTQQQMDDMLMGSGEFMPSPHDISQVTARPSSRAAATRRTSISSTTSGRTNIFPWSRNKKGSSAGALDFDDDDDGSGGIHFDDGSLAGAPNVGLSDLTGLRDRDRYPTMSGNPKSGTASDTGSIRNGGRTMSISSNMSSGGFDTTPYIPTLKSTQNNQQYRKTLNNSRKQAYVRPPNESLSPPLSVRGSAQYSGRPGRPPGGNSSPLMSPNFGPSAGPPRPYSGGMMQGSDPRLRSLTGPAPQMDYLGISNNAPRTMSMTAGNFRNGPAPPMAPMAGPGPGQRISRPPSRLSGMPNPNGGMHLSENAGFPQYKRVSASTMTDPVASASSSSHSYGSPSTVDLGVQTDNTSIESHALVSAAAATASEDTSREIAQKDKQVKELQAMNRSLLDEVRLVTSELADSIRREMSLESGIGGDVAEDESSRHSLAKKIVMLESQIDMERRKRQVAEASLNHGAMAELSELYDYLEMERNMAEKDRLYLNEQRENELLRENVEQMSNEIEALQIETNQLKNGIVPNLKSHVKDLEVLTAAGNPIELLKQIEELKVENKTIQALVEKNSTRGPIGEKIKSVEGQRDVLREALRSLREKKDHEVRQTTERVRQLESRLEKERVINHQIQRKLVQTRSAMVSSPTNGAFPHSNSSDLTSSGNYSDDSNATANGHANSASTDSNFDPSFNSNGTTSAYYGKENIRKFSSNGLQPPSAGFASNDDARRRSGSPVSFEISQEPAFLDYVDPRHRQTAAAKRGLKSRDSTSAVPLSLPNGRSEQLPLSLGQATS